MGEKASYMAVDKDLKKPEIMLRAFPYRFSNGEETFGTSNAAASFAAMLTLWLDKYGRFSLDTFKNTRSFCEQEERRNYSNRNEDDLVFSALRRLREGSYVLSDNRYGRKEIISSVHPFDIPFIFKGATDHARAFGYSPESYRYYIAPNFYSPNDLKIETYFLFKNGEGFPFHPQVHRDSWLEIIYRKEGINSCHVMPQR